MTDISPDAAEVAGKTEPELPVLCVQCFLSGRLVRATGYRAGNSLCETHEDFQSAQWDAVADAMEGAL